VRAQLQAQREALESYLASGSREPAAGAELFGHLGRLYHIYDLLEAATTCYRNANRLAPEDRRWIYLIGIVHQKQGELDAAAASFEHALRLSPGDPPTLVRLAEVELERQNLDAAADLFEQALSEESTAAAAHHGLGKIAAARREFAAAADHFERVLALQPEASRVHFALAQAYLRLGRREEATAQLERQGTVAVAIADPLMAEVMAGSASAAQLTGRAAAAVRAGRLDEAELEYRRAVAMDPENATARLGLAGLLAKKGALAESAEEYREAIRLNPDNAGIRVNLGLVLKQSGAVGEALEEFRAAVRADPSDRGFRQHLALQLADAGLYDEAEPHYRELVQSDPNDVPARLELATLLFQQGRSEDARAMAATVLDLDAKPRNRAQALLVIANSHEGSGSRERSLDALREATELDPSFASAHLQLANFLGMEGRYMEAAAAYRSARELEQDTLPAWLGESTALVLAGQEAAAIRILELGLAVFPREPRLSGRLARLLVGASEGQLHDPQRALELAQGAFALAPSLELAETIATALAATGQFDEALAWQERLLTAARESANEGTLERLEADLERYRRQMTP
jgi:tetratricopeptide (TPR) repeat protein